MLQVRYKRRRSILQAEYYKHIERLKFSKPTQNENAIKVFDTMKKIKDENGLTNGEYTAKELYDNFCKYSKYAFDKLFDNITFESLICSDYEKLEEITKEISENEKKLSGDEMKYKVNFNIAINYIFNYKDKFQTYISKFFEDNIELYTCYYCNIDYVNVFSSKYTNYIDFLNNATEKELLSIENIGQATVNKIANYKKTNKFTNNNDLNTVVRGKKKIDTLKNLDLKSLFQKNAFTLDHVIDKGKFPYLALSLFNLVPSCSTCNSKLKIKQSISGKSPTSAKFSFHEEVKFKGFLSRDSYVKDLLKAELSKIDFRLNITNPDYKAYIKVFRLNDRYNFHKANIAELIEKRSKYPDSYIKDISQKLGYTEKEIKNDLFDGLPHHKDELHKKSLSKYRTDIAEQLGLI
jgi:hypothetical protein